MSLAFAALLLLLHTALIPAGAGTVSGVLVSRRDAPPDAVDAHAARHSLLWGLAVVATVASGVVHAAAAPHHAEENLLFGVFFVAAAVAQFFWSTLALLSPSRSLLRWGVVVNVALIVLWAVTRTVGLPGLLDGPEEVGWWDVSSKVWELVALLCCLGLLTRTADDVGPGSGRHGRRNAWLVCSFLSVSAAALWVLAMTGPPS